MSEQTWPAVPKWMVNPLVFRDANLGIVLVAGADGDQMIHRVTSDGRNWVTVRKVDERDGFKLVEALNVLTPAAPATGGRGEAEQIAADDRRTIEEIGRLCFAAGLSTPDGTVLPMVKRLLAAQPESAASARSNMQ